LSEGGEAAGSGERPIAVRRAEPGDAADVARLLHDFNTEFDDPTPGVPALTERAREMLAAGEIVVLLAGDGPDGLSQFRFLRSIWSGALDVYLEELYVVPGRRGQGIGRALLEATMTTAREGGATHIDLNTGETDWAARSLYESAGFTNREGGADGPSMLYYERDL
jgi:ribosomal protein S18 acetylase RimI-like enzyme